MTRKKTFFMCLLYTLGFPVLLIHIAGVRIYGEFYDTYFTLLWEAGETILNGYIYAFTGVKRKYDSSLKRKNYYKWSKFGRYIKRKTPLKRHEIMEILNNYSYYFFKKTRRKPYVLSFEEREYDNYYSDFFYVSNGLFRDGQIRRLE